MAILISQLQFSNKVNKKKQYNNYKIGLVDLQDSNLWNTKLDVLSPARNSLCVQGTVWGLLAACDNHYSQLQRMHSKQRTTHTQHTRHAASAPNYHNEVIRRMF